MESEIQRFYRDKTIFLTGGTGFLGKAIIEKLLRTTDVARIYILIRRKRGQEIQERLDTWGKDSVFEVLLKSNPQALERVKPITGDCKEPDLGLTQADRALLAKETQLVLHGAATVRFNEALHVALAINTRATRLVLQLAKQMHRLEAFVHISTAFSNCVVEHVKERFYPENLTCSAAKVLKLSEELGDELLDNMAPVLLGKFPNTYTYTKALAEDVVLSESGQFPISIFRPGFIIATHKEPVTGWIDNMYGPIAMLYGVAHGVLRLNIQDYKCQASVVPVDFCANVALTSACKTAKDSSQVHNLRPPIYTFTPSEQNLLTAGGFNDRIRKFGYSYPINKMIWYPFMHSTSIPWLYHFAAFFYHTLPGFFFDSMLWLSGRKPRLLKIYRRINKNVVVLQYFTTRSWRFDTQNTNRLWQDLTPQDQKLYNFDMSLLDWDEYFKEALFGMRLYLAKEPPTQESLEQALKRLRQFRILHRLLQFFLCCVAGYVLWWMFKLGRIFL